MIVCQALLSAVVWYKYIHTHGRARRVRQACVRGKTAMSAGSYTGSAVIR